MLVGVLKFTLAEHELGHSLNKYCVKEFENKRLHRERRQLLEQREENTELVKAVKEKRSLAKRRAEAGLLTKTKWALFGMKDEDEDGDDL